LRIPIPSLQTLLIGKRKRRAIGVDGRRIKTQMSPMPLYSYEGNYPRISSKTPKAGCNSFLG